MSVNWNNVKPACCARWLVLPTVYSDALSYGEQLDKFCYQLNKLIENNNILPDFISDMIKEYINSGAIGEVVRDILANYILNVKYPPKGIKPAVGDGSADDTEAIQGCIDYAEKHDGMCVYIPSGKYLCQSLTAKHSISLFGFDRYSSKIVLKGGAISPLISGSIKTLNLVGLWLDGNMDIQVNNVNLIDVVINSGLISNTILTDGYTLINAEINNEIEINNTLLKHSVENGIIISGEGVATCNNLTFNSVSELLGKRYIISKCNNSMFTNITMIGKCPVGVEITGNNNTITFNKGKCIEAFIDSGTGNNVYSIGDKIKTSLISDKTESIGGDFNSIVKNNITIKSSNVNDTTGRREQVSDNYNETVNSNKIVNVKNLQENIETDKHTTVNGVWQNTANGNKIDDINGNYERHVVGTLIDTIDSLYTSIFKKGAIKNVTGSDTETITNEKVITAKNSYKVYSPKYYIDVAIKELAKNIKGFKSVYLKNGDEISIVTSVDEKTLNEFITPELFGAIGDGNADDSDSLNNAINFCATNSCELTLRPNSIYGIKKALIIKDKVSINGNYATIKALANMNELVKFELADNNRKSHTVKGVIFDCNLMAINGVTYTRTSRNIFKDCVITNFAGVGLTQLLGYELIVEDVFIIANRNTIGATGIISGSDSYFTNICVQDCKYAVIIKGSGSFFNNIHAWIYDESLEHSNLKGSVFITVTGNSTGSNNYISNVYSDTMQYSFKITQYNVVTISNLFVLNGGGKTGFSSEGLNEHAVIFYNPNNVDTRDIKLLSGCLIGGTAGFTDFSTNFIGVVNKLTQVSNINGYSWYRTIPINKIDVTVINDGKCYITDTTFNCVCQLTQPKNKWVVGSTLCTIDVYELSKFATSDFINIIAVYGTSFDSPSGVIPLLLNTKTGGILIKTDLPGSFTNNNVFISFEFFRFIIK